MDLPSEENVSDSHALTEQCLQNHEALVSRLVNSEGCIDRFSQAENSLLPPPHDHEICQCVEFVHPSPDKGDENGLQKHVDQSGDVQMSPSTETRGDTEAVAVDGPSSVDRLDLIVSEKEQGLQGPSVSSPLADESSYCTDCSAACDSDTEACDITETIIDQGSSVADNVEDVVSRNEDSLSVYPPPADEFSSLCESLTACDIDPEQAKDRAIYVQGFDVSLSKKEARESLVPAFEELSLGKEAETQEALESVAPICAQDGSHDESNFIDSASGVMCGESCEFAFLSDNDPANSLRIVVEEEGTEAEDVTCPDKTCSVTQDLLLDSHDNAQRDKTERCERILEDDDKGLSRTAINKSEGTNDTVGTSNKPESFMPMVVQAGSQEAEESAQRGAIVLEVHGETDIVEEDNASIRDDRGIHAAMIGNVVSPTSDARSADVDKIDAECYQGLSQTEHEAESSECQHHGYTIDKDGSSSLDSTAGSGWKLQAMDGGNGTEDEEANSTGGEDFSSSPACVLPTAQQRKKINIHHQFVREIVKIQHDREQYDREQAERQILAQRAANGAQFVRSPDIKEHKSSMQDRKESRTDTIKMSMQRGPNEGDGPTKESQQKHATRAKKALPVQAKSGSFGYASMETKEQRMPSSSQVQESMEGREYGRTGRGKQRSSMSIYRPPVVRDSLAAEQRTVVELDTSRHQSEMYAVSTSPDSASSSASKPGFPYVGSPDESRPKLGRSSSVDGHVHGLEAKVEQPVTPGVSIKVTFDTERKLRHIEFSEGLDSNGSDLAASRRKSNPGMSKVLPTVNPLIGSTFQGSKLSTGGPSTINSRQAGFDETLPQWNDPYLTQANKISSRLQATISRAERNSWSQESRGAGVTQGSPPSGSADRNSWSQASFTGELSRSQAKLGTPSRNTVERKPSFFEQADKGAFKRSSGGSLQKSPSPVDAHSIMDDRRDQIDTARQSGGHAGDIRMPSTLLQGFSMASSHRGGSIGPPYRGNLPATNSLPAFGRSTDPSNLSSQLRGSFQSQSFSVSRSQQDAKGKQKATSSFWDDKFRSESQSRTTTMDSGSPFQAMMRDPPSSRPQVPYSSPASQMSGYHQTNFQQTYGLAWNVDDRTSSCNYPHETLKRSQSDSLKKASTQALQVQLPSKETLFTTMPMQEKWGDIVDDSPDAFDYNQTKAEAARDSTSASLFYGANNHGSAMFVDVGSFRGDTSLYKDKRRDKVTPKYADRFVQNQPAGFGTPARKSVFERLGAQGNFKESILGPPPKVLDNRGLLKPSPDAFMSNSQTMNIFHGYDPYYGSPQMSQNLSGALHDSGGSYTTDEGREVVVQAYTDMKQKRSKRELYVPRRGL